MFLYYLTRINYSLGEVVKFGYINSSNKPKTCSFWFY